MSLSLSGRFDLTSPDFSQIQAHRLLHITRRSIFTQKVEITLRKKQRFYFSSHSELLHCEQTHHPITVAVRNRPQARPPQQHQWLTSSLSVSLSTKLYLTNEMHIILNTTCD